MADVEQTDDIDPEDVQDLAEVVPEDLSEDDLEVADEPVLDEDAFDPDAEVEADEVVVDPAVEATPKPAPTKAKAATGKGTARSDDDDEDDDEDEEDDVEADLDTILKDRIAAPPDDDEDEEVAPIETDDRSEGAGKIQPRKPGEFVCQSCFLVKHPSQLADSDDMLCADCV